MKLNHYRPLTVFNFKNNYYQNYENTYFKNKKFGKDYIEYYDTIKSLICDYDTIHNLSFDRSFHYLCENKKNYTPGSYYKIFLTNEINLEYLKKNNVGKSILISDNIITDLQIVKKIKLPYYFRYSKTDHGYVYFTDTIYIYEL